ncbi:MAG TPA: choline/ethanolamine kinase family protein [Steroidobacteraceae bacterium]|jgi:thiamine kinase
MQPGEVEQLGRRVVPGTGSLDIEHLSSGLVNDLYRVVRDDATFAFRAARERPVHLGQDLAWEAKILLEAAGMGIAPPLEYCDPERGVLVMRWIDGRSWTPTEAHTSACIGRFAALLRRVHALPIPAPARNMNPLSWMDVYGAALSRREPGGPDPALQKTAVLAAAELAAYPKPQGVVCHSDLHSQNLIENDAALLLLDWEYVHVSDPLWDVAGWCANNNFDAPTRRHLLASYLGATPTVEEAARCQLLGWLYDYICLLWSQLFLYLRGDPGGLIGARATHLDARLRIPANYRP